MSGVDYLNGIKIRKIQVQLIGISTEYVDILNLSTN